MNPIHAEDDEDVRMGGTDEHPPENQRDPGSEEKPFFLLKCTHKNLFNKVTGKMRELIIDHDDVNLSSIGESGCQIMTQRDPTRPCKLPPVGTFTVQDFLYRLTGLTPENIPEQLREFQDVPITCALNEEPPKRQRTPITPWPEDTRGILLNTGIPNREFKEEVAQHVQRRCETVGSIALKTAIQNAPAEFRTFWVAERNFFFIFAPSEALRNDMLAAITEARRGRPCEFMVRSSTRNGLSREVRAEPKQSTKGNASAGGRVQDRRARRQAGRNNGDQADAQRNQVPQYRYVHREEDFPPMGAQTRGTAHESYAQAARPPPWDQRNGAPPSQHPTPTQDQNNSQNGTQGHQHGRRDWEQEMEELRQETRNMQREVMATVSSMQREMMATMKTMQTELVELCRNLIGAKGATNAHPNTSAPTPGPATNTSTAPSSSHHAPPATPSPQTQQETRQATTPNSTNNDPTPNTHKSGATTPQQAQSNSGASSDAATNSGAPPKTTPKQTTLPFVATRDKRQPQETTSATQQQETPTPMAPEDQAAVGDENDDVAMDTSSDAQEQPSDDGGAEDSEENSANEAHNDPASKSMDEYSPPSTPSDSSDQAPTKASSPKRPRKNSGTNSQPNTNPTKGGGRKKSAARK